MSDGTKKLCMVVHAYYPLGETRVQREAEALLDQGYQVDVVCLRRPGEPAVAVHRGIGIHRLPVGRHKNSGAFVQFWEYLAFLSLAFFKLSALHLRKRYDVVQVHNPPDFLVFAALVPKLAGTPLILDLHDLMPEFFLFRFGAGRESLPARLVFWQEQIACRFADHVITVTEHWRQSLIERGVPGTKCSVLMNLADPRIFCRPAQIDRRRDQDQLHLVYHGAIPEHNGLDLALRAVAQLRAESPGLRLTVIGWGEHLDELLRLTTELGLEEQVRFEGFMPVEELPAHILAADLAVVPYRDNLFTGELLPTKLLEYAALGVPAIASRTRGISAYFDDTMVQFFAPGDANELASCIRELHHDRDRLAALAENIQEFNRRHNWQNQSAEYGQLVDRLGRAGKDMGGR
jgi:glycosyltransferase involved in cell wall biosynthesis